jgi:circadian clock protein KaiC
MSEINRVPIGIKQLDEILKGGLPEGGLYLIAGGPGAGKTILGSAFIYFGAMRYGDPGLYVTFNEKSESFRAFVSTLNWDFQKLEDMKKVKIIDFVVTRDRGLETALTLVVERVKMINAKRLVLDSITALSIAMNAKIDARSLCSMLQRQLRPLNCTSILIAETPWGFNGIGSGVEEFVADGIIMLESFTERAELKKRLAVVKMRGTDIDPRFYRYTITKDVGFSLVPFPE